MSSFSGNLPKATSTSPLLSRSLNSYSTIAALGATETSESENNDHFYASTEEAGTDNMSIQAIYSNIRQAVSGTTGQQEYSALPQNPLPHKRDDSSRPGSISSDDTEKSPEDGAVFCSPRRWISPRVISDATIGLSDGLTVPFALTAGLSALGDTQVVIYGGMAELFAGAISMGLGGYLGARSEW